LCLRAMISQPNVNMDLSDLYILVSVNEIKIPRPLSQATISNFPSDFTVIVFSSEG
jgi:hypothetical protein